jgi:hypothetical protein
MCPLCGEHDGKPCPVEEMRSGRLTCGCGKHSWPNSGVFLETCRRLSLTITGQPHIWTQSY